MINDHGPDCFFKINPFKSLNFPYNPEVQSLEGHIPAAAGECQVTYVLDWHVAGQLRGCWLGLRDRGGVAGACGFRGSWPVDWVSLTVSGG